ncbi:DNA packaging protein [Macropodid alphaherpesvirus 2]|uniref:DNA packaging protein n=1 Tax=Macropodid alphaherpesvirus 2 TaxID=83440 RepID=A0AAE7MLP0_9ALPH|nr:DNA packaging protein [Macropodid alphaherpesvirus 2]QOD40253.1 DNA packaging protein [Macropodid alphaherpesvirus 2]WGO49731.1 DNA packaging protein [Macropodid alphaherpesvirus 2]
MSGSSTQNNPALRDIIPEHVLTTTPIDTLAAQYLSRDNNNEATIWFEDLTPLELEVVFPTTDAKLNYLSRTQRLASLLARRPDIKDPGCEDPTHRQPQPCMHTELLVRRKEKFATVINRFLDLHQILKG